MSSALGTDLVEVTVETSLGAKYVFPDMPRTTLDNVIQLKGWKYENPFILVNVSGACLSVPMRIVATVSYDGEVKWKGPACSPA